MTATARQKQAPQTVQNSCVVGVANTDADGRDIDVDSQCAQTIRSAKVHHS